MRRRHHPRTEAGEIGSDSFLDVVANIVGILIILVLVVGVRVKNLPAEALTADAEPAAPTIDLDAPQQTAARLQTDVLALASEINTVKQTAALAFAERNRLADRVAAAQRALEERRQSLGAGEESGLALSRERARAQEALARAERELAALESQPTRPTEIESFPTPLSKTVDGQEGHFQVREGRITPIPLDRLLDWFRRDAEQKIWKLRDSSSFTDVVGPIGGFRMRYTLERVDVGMQGGRGRYAELTEWKLMPAESRMGESLETALAPRSEFRAALAAIDPQTTTVTLWVYPDSFDVYRTLRKEMFRLGYPTAGRPLPDGILIGGSPQGTKSAVQ